MLIKIIKIIIIIIFGFICFNVGLNFYNKCDVNHDGKVNSLDLLFVQKEILKEGEKNE